MRLFAFIIISAFGFISNAKAADECRHALIKDTTQFTSEVSRYLSFLNVVDRQSYSSSKKDIDAGAKALIKGVPFEASFGFDKFQEYRSRVFRQFEYKEDTQSAVSYLHSALSGNSVRAYIACLESNSKENGFHAFPSYVDGEVVAVSLRWSQSFGNPQAAPVKVIYARGTDTPTSTIPTQIDPNKTVSFLFERQTGQNFCSSYRRRWTDTNNGSYGGRSQY